jgi:hypothetical protein
VIWLLVVATVLLLMARMVRPFAEAPLCKLLLLPGALLGALSRSLGCWATGTELKGVHLWRRGPVVQHGKPGFVGKALIAILPFAFAGAGVMVSFSLLSPPIDVSVELPELEPDVGEATVVLTVWRQMAVALVEALREVPDPLDLGLLLFVWLSISALVYGAPSFEEWKVQALSLVVGWAVVAACSHWGVGARFLSKAWFADLYYAEALWSGLALLMLMTLVSVAVVLGILAVGSLLRALVLPSRSAD